MSVYDTILVDGVDLDATYGITAWASVVGYGEMPDTALRLPGKVGAVSQFQTIGARTVQVGLENVGTGADYASKLASFNDNMRALKKLMVTGRGKPTVTLSRRQSFSTGNEQHDGTAQYLRGLEPSLAFFNYGTVLVDFLLTSGVFYATADATINPGTVTVNGETATTRMSITLPGAGTLTNSTAGVSVTVTAAATLNVLNFTATAGLSTLTHSGDDYWFVLLPGSNTITWSGTGTPSIAYRAAYL